MEEPQVPQENTPISLIPKPPAPKEVNPAPEPRIKFGPTSQNIKTIDSNGSYGDINQSPKINLQEMASGLKKSKADEPNLKNIRTYEGDVADILAHNRTSTASIAIAESRRQEVNNSMGKEENPHTTLKLIMILGSLILIAVGAFGAYYFFMKSPFATSVVVVQNQKITSLIPSDSQTTISVDGMNANKILASISNEMSKPMVSDNIKEIIPIQTQNGLKSRLGATQMLAIMNIPAPDILVRSLTPTWMLGVYSSDNGNQSAFVVVTTNFFQNAFAGMLQWENVMADDLRQYLYPIAPKGIANINETSTTTEPLNPLQDINNILPVLNPPTPTASSTNATNSASTIKPNKPIPGRPAPGIATSSIKTHLMNATSTIKATTTQEIVATSTIAEPVITPYLTVKGKFIDRIVKNKDVREFISDNGSILFLYSFIDNTKLVITSNEDTLAEIITRLEKQSFVR